MPAWVLLVVVRSSVCFLLAAVAVSGTASAACAESDVRSGTASPLAAPTPPADPLASCQRAIERRGRRFVAGRIAALDRCTAALVRCVEVEPNDGACLGRAGARCARTLESVVALQARFHRAIASACNRADLPLERLLDPSGLGFDAITAACEALGIPITATIDLTECITGQHRCTADRVLALTRPRARELLRVVGLAAGELDGLACLPDYGGDGASVGDAVVVGPALRSCDRALARALRTLAERELATIERCASAIAACGEGAGGECIGAAAGLCARGEHRLDRMRERMRAAVTRRCAGDVLPFTVLASPAGAGVQALEETCARIGVTRLAGTADWAACLERRTACETAALVPFETPRAAELLPLVDRILEPEFCREPTPPEPTATPTPTRTARPDETATPTRTPLPGETATPTATASRVQATATRTRTPRPTPRPTPVCGNGVIDGDEECDGADLDDNTCDDLCFDEPDPPGPLRCTRACTFDFSGCRGTDCEP